LPIEKAEGETLELKSLGALREPETIAREAVAMLNSMGGEIWIGIKEGRSKNEPEPMPGADAAREKRRLEDHLLDVIEPTPMEGEVAVTDEPVGDGVDDGGRVLRVSLKPNPARRPYALRRHGGRFFLRRFGARIVPMSREEIGAAFHETSSVAAKDEAPAALRKELNALIEQAASRFWLGLEPERAGDLKLRELRKTELLVDPTFSGTPRHSYNFTAVGYRGSVRIDNSQGKAALMIGDDIQSLRIYKSGGVRFAADLAETFWAGRVPFVEADRLLSPEALLGYVISVVRLEGRLFEEAPLWHHFPEGDIWAALGITGLQGWGLLPGDLAAWPSYRYQIRRFQDQDLLLQEPLRFTQEKLRDHPEECGMRLVEQIYDAFGIDLLPSISGASLGHAGLPPLEHDGYSRWVGLDLGGGTLKVARLRRDNLRPSRFEWETRDGDLIPAEGRWVHGWRPVE
jgi:hypothetical protein